MCGEVHEGCSDSGVPEHGDGAGDKGRRDKAEHDGEHEELHPEGLHDPAHTVSVRVLHGIEGMGCTSGATRLGGWSRRATMRG